MISIQPRIFQRVLMLIPNILWAFKKRIIKYSLAKAGKNVKLGLGCILNDHRKIVLGNNIFIGHHSTISTNVPLIIGSYVMFGPEVMVIGGDHNLTVVGKRMIEVKTGGINLPIVIEDDSWVGARAIILKGVTIREGSIIGAGSIVNRNTLPYSINAGNPCKFIKPRFSKNELIQHISAVSSKYLFDEIVTMYKSQGIELSLDEK